MIKLLKKSVKKIIPKYVVKRIKNRRYTYTRTKIRILEKFGYNLSKVSDYYAPLPTFSIIQKNRDRWDRPSSMAGISYDIVKFQSHLTDLISKFGDEFKALPDYKVNQSIGFGPGFTEVDAFVLI